MPKKKGGKKGAKIVDGVATNEMTREQLMAHVKRMQVVIIWARVGPGGVVTNPLSIACSWS